MKQTIFLSTMLIALLMFSTCGNIEQNEEKTGELKGRVRSVHTSAYYAIDILGELSKERYAYGVEDFYDENGNLIEKNKFHREGEVMTNSTYRYDKNGNLIEETDYSFGRFERKAKYSYDNIGNKTEQRIYNSYGSLLNRFRYYYDSSGNLTLESRYWTNNLSTPVDIKYTYGSNGKLIEKNEYFKRVELGNGDYRGGSIFKTIYSYDNNGNKIKESKYDSEGVLRKEIRYSYDNNGNKTKESEYDSKGVLRKEIRDSYDNKGNLIEKKYYEYYNVDGSSISREIKYSYDSNGNPLEEISIPTYGRNCRYYDYEYDSKKNWIRRVSDREEIDQWVTVIEEREIKYWTNDMEHAHYSKPNTDVVCFVKYNLPNVGYISIPNNMKILSKAELQEMGISRNDVFSFQSKEGVSNATITITTEIGNYGDFEKLTNNWTLTQAELNELDNETKKELLLGYSQIGIGFELLNWTGVSMALINGNTAIKYSYQKKINNKLSVVDEVYMFHNNDRMHSLSLSYVKSGENLWKPLFPKIINSFVITNIR